MKIVIDIPEEVFDEIYNKNYYSLKGKEALRVAVRGCTPLPKGHGKLKDVDAISLDDIGFFSINDYLKMVHKLTTDEDTIIEADKEERNESSN